MSRKSMFQSRNRKSLIHHPLFLLCGLSLLIAGCTFYNVIRLSDIEADKKKLTAELQKPEKYLILQTPGQAFQFKLKELNLDEEFMIGELMPLPSTRENYKETSSEWANLQKLHLDRATQEIHFYTDVSYSVTGELIKLSFLDFNRIEIYELDYDKTSLVTLGAVAGGAFLIAAIILATKSSCPFIYTKDTTGYVFSGEIYPGAIYKALERDDFLKLTKLTVSEDQYQIKLSNELMERQYTDLCRLIEVHHSPEVEVYLDKAGNVHTISELKSPISSHSGEGVEVSSQINCRDDNFYSFNETSGKAGMNELYLNFEKPQDKLNAKLVLHGKNTYWLDYTFGKFYNNFGTYYEKHASLQDESEADTNIQWAIDQGIRLGVWIKKHDRWVLVDNLEVAGPLSNRTMIIPLDLHGISGSNVEVKLISGFMFWEFDQIGIDFSENEEVSIHYLEAVQAIDQDGIDVRNTLIKTDGNYLEQPGPGLETNISFRPALKMKDKQSSIFLHSRGYYEYIRDYTNYPDILTLNSFKKAGAFSEFSRDNYLQFRTNRSPQNTPSL